MVELNLFHYRERPTPLHHSHPITKIVALLLLSTLLAKGSLIRIGSISLFLITLTIIQRIPLKLYFRELRFFVLMGLIMGGVRYLTSWELLETLSVVIRFFSIVLMGILFTDSTAADDLARSVREILKPIMPQLAYRISSAMELTLTTIPLVLDISFQIREARKARLEMRWRHPIKRIVEFFVAIFALLLQRIEELEQALIARGYRIDAQRGNLSYSKTDALVGVTLSLFGTLLLLFT